MKKLILILLIITLCLPVFSAIPSGAEQAPTAPVYYGTQQMTLDAGQNIRFISLVNSDLGSSVGYVITAKYAGGTKTFTYEDTATKVVYSSIIVEGVEYSSEELGSGFGLMTLVITGIPTDAGIIDFTVTPCVMSGGNLIEGETCSVRYNGTKCEGRVDNIGAEDNYEISLMTFNVLNVWYNGTLKNEGLSVKDRSNATAQIVLENRVDFVCFQEFDPLYRSGANFGDEFNAKYSELSLTDKTSDAQAQNNVTYQSRIWNPIFYDNTQYTVIDCGVFDFVEWGLDSVEYDYYHGEADNSKSDARSLVWGVFKHKTTGQLFIVGNTHFSAEFDDTATLTWTEVSRQEGEFVAEKLNELYDVYACPVVCAGDYNTRKVNTNGYKTVLAGGFYDTWDMAAYKLDSSGYHEKCKNRSGYSSSVAPDSKYEYALDHILTRNKLKVSSYEIIKDKTFTGYTYVDSVLDLSDHCPVIMRFYSESQSVNIGIDDTNAKDVTVTWR